MIDIDAIEARMADPYGYLDAGEIRDDVMALIAEVKRLQSVVSRMELERNDVDAELDECTEERNALIQKARSGQ